MTLLLDGRMPGPDDVTALRTAAAPLLAMLHERHLLTTENSPGPTTPLPPTTTDPAFFHTTTNPALFHTTTDPAAVHHTATSQTAVHPTNPAHPHTTTGQTAVHLTPTDPAHPHTATGQTAVHLTATDPAATHTAGAGTAAGEPEGKQR